MQVSLQGWLILPIISRHSDARKVLPATPGNLMAGLAHLGLPSFVPGPEGEA